MFRLTPDRVVPDIPGETQFLGDVGTHGLVVRVRYAPHSFPLLPFPLPQHLVHKC